MEKKIIIIFFFGIYLIFPAYAQEYNDSYTPSLKFHSCNSSDNCNEYPAVGIIERDVFGCTFQYNNIYQRLGRLENAVLGSVFLRDSLYDRVERLKRASNEGHYSPNSEISRNITQEYINNSPLEFSWQKLNNSCSDNSTYNNEYYSSSQNTSGLQKILDIAIPLINSFTGSNYEYNNYSYNPNYLQDYNYSRNSNFGAGVRILP